MIVLGEPVIVFVDKKEWEWFQEMEAEGRTRTLEVSSFRRFEDEKREVCLQLRAFPQEEQVLYEKRVQDAFNYKNKEVNQ